MTEVISHRGPDGAGLWSDNGIALGHRRLSIIDLSAAAAQPMQTPDGRYVLTYNGEIYNHRELRNNLENSELRSVHPLIRGLLHLFAREGLPCLEKNGFSPLRFGIGKAAHSHWPETTWV